MLGRRIWQWIQKKTRRFVAEAVRAHILVKKLNRSMSLQTGAGHEVSVYTCHTEKCSLFLRIMMALASLLGHACGSEREALSLLPTACCHCCAQLCDSSPVDSICGKPNRRGADTEGEEGGDEIGGPDAEGAL